MELTHPLAASATKAWANLESMLCHGRESVQRRSGFVASLLLLLLRLLLSLYQYASFCYCGHALSLAIVCRLLWREKALYD